MISDDSKWVQMIHYEFKWSTMSSNDPQWVPVTLLSSCDLLWVLSDPNQLFPPWQKDNISIVVVRKKIPSLKIFIVNNEKLLKNKF